MSKFLYSFNPHNPVAYEHGAITYYRAYITGGKGHNYVMAIDEEKAVWYALNGLPMKKVSLAKFSSIEKVYSNA